MKRYHQAVYDEPLIFQIGHKGERGQLVPKVEAEIQAAVGDVVSHIPTKMRRKQPPALPEVSEPEVVRHYLRMSQQTIGELGFQIGHGTSTVKYNPKINEQLARMPSLTNIHPCQDEETAQGILEVLYQVSRWFCEISGFDEFTFQPAGGGHGQFACASIIKAFHKLNGELEQRREIIIPVKSHPCIPAAAAIAGFKIIAVYPDEQGCTPIEAVKAAVSKRTAGMMMTNPQEFSVFDNNIEEHVKTVHEAGGLMAYDMANYNGLFGITRAGDIGFDMGHFNVHKTFSSPHGSGGPGSGPVGVKEELKKFLPVPVVEFDGGKYKLNYNKSHSIGKIRGFYGNVGNAVRALAWMMTMGAEGLREVGEVAALNANYLAKKLAEIRGIRMLMGETPFRPRAGGQAEFNLDELKDETGIGLQEINMRIIDHGHMTCETGHHPYILTENPCALEPTESVSKANLDEYIKMWKQIVHEAYTNPEVLKTAPHNTAYSTVDSTIADDPQRWAVSWRAYLRKIKQ
ncbi:MAG: aminomethyl-transferring glycine dehydrogenase subunit GcvPB [Candidatus Bathyarchaeota archaeon]|nr:MAG: aminomethyl-transferring glycine dehydrogenase subunit GcvPB [Candidatus Bathyarchaeota archaeon]